MIETRNLSVKIGEKHILEDISVRIESGKVTAIIGPNGAGKSTLLKYLTGLRKAGKGTVTLENIPIEDYSLNDLSIRRAVLLQSEHISFPFTVLEITMMGRNPYAHGGYTSNDIATVIEVLECVDAIHLKDRVFPTLSGGEKQRVQLARVLVQLWDQKNAYLFFDEPTAALDLKHQHQILSLVTNMAEKRRFAVCIIVHDLSLAVRYADQVILLKGGKVFAAGDTREILNAYSIEKVFELSQEFVFLSGNFSKIAVPGHGEDARSYKAPSHD